MLLRHTGYGIRGPTVLRPYDDVDICIREGCRKCLGALVSLGAELGIFALVGSLLRMTHDEDRGCGLGRTVHARAELGGRAGRKKDERRKRQGSNHGLGRSLW